MAFPSDKLSPEGFKIPATAARTFLADGTVVEDNALFHRGFLFNPEMRVYIRKAGIQPVCPAAGFKEGGHRKKPLHPFWKNF